MQILHFCVKGFERIVRIIGNMTEKENQTQLIALTSAADLRDKIYEIRGQKVMLDRDLAEIYGYNLSAFNQQVSRNQERFTSDFCFRLTREELDNLVISQNVISPNIAIFQGQSGGIRKLPLAVTEQGIYMLMTILKGKLAITQSIALIRLFKQMKDILINQRRDYITSQQFLQLSEQVNNNTKTIKQLVTKSELQDFMVNFTDEHLGRELLILDGQTLEAAVAYQQILAQAKESIYLIDNYVSLQTLLRFKDVGPEITVTIFSSNTGKNLQPKDLQTFQREYPQVNLTLKPTHGKVHDRFIVLDYATPSEKAYLCGGSLKDTGRKVTMIMIITDPGLLHELVNKLIM